MGFSAYYARVVRLEPLEADPLPGVLVAPKTFHVPTSSRSNDRPSLELALAPVCCIGAVVGLVQGGHRRPPVLARDHFLGAVMM